MAPLARAVIDCPEPIPCDPCVRACPRGAIRMPGGITGLPSVDEEACTGCGVCVPRCPGHAIVVADRAYGPGEDAVALPYEFLPLPGEGELVLTVDRVGSVVGRGRVVRGEAPRAFERTPVVTVAVPAGEGCVVRGLRREGEAV